MEEKTMMIRLAVPEELAEVREIVRQTIAAVYPHYYPAGVVAFFDALHRTEAIEADIRQRKVYMVLTEQRAIATVTIDGDEISRLFVLPDCQHRGYGSQILDWAEEMVFAAHDSVRLHASLPGKGIYLQRGYQPVDFHRREVDGHDWLCVDIMAKSRPAAAEY